MTFPSETLPDRVASVEAAFDACRRLARRHYENFPVASIFLPHRIRPAVAAVYAFARCADDFADEPGADGPTRLARLADWRRRLTDGANHGGHPVFWAIHEVREKFKIPPDPFDRLITAFEWDVRHPRHETFDDLLTYCRYSANPVGELVLRLMGGWTPSRAAGSDAICTGLQLANFWQDVTVDAAQNRIYVPLKDMAGAGVNEKEVLTGPVTRHLRTLVAGLVERTWTIFMEGGALLDDLPSGLRWELPLVWLGGTEILRKIERQKFDVWSRRPALSRWDWIRLGARWARGGVGKR